MFKSLSQALIATLMLIALLGQSLSYAHAACEMSTDLSHSTSEMDHSSMLDHKGMDHQNMMMDMSDCCSADCSCPASNCTSASQLAPKQSPLSLAGSSAIILTHSLQYPKAITSSLFRPPILA